MNLSFFADKIFVISLLTAIASASTEVPIWISGVTLVMLAWRYAFERWNIPKASTRMTAVLGALIFVLVFIQKRTIFGPEESSTILLGLVAITILNYTTQRDRYFLVLLGFLMVTLKALFSIDFFWIAPALAAFFGFWYSLINTQTAPRARLLLKLTLQALPIFVVLFLIFPRIVIFQTERIQKNRVSSGFSENLNPGSISEVVNQTRSVFHVDFGERKFVPSALYWRGSVLTRSDGMNWRKESAAKAPITVTPIDPQSIYYKVVVEPSNVRNVFVLETPLKMTSMSVTIERLEDQIYSLLTPSNQQFQFEALAEFQPLKLSDTDEKSLEKYLTTTPLPPLSQEAVDRIRKEHPALKERVQALQEFFFSADLAYTLTPGTYPNNNIDELLFRRKKGFCEHFAGAYGTLARALEIPSRVVIGYQGGTYNKRGNFWTVTQKDAHAWVEIAVDGKWHRVDPTRWIAPLRLELGGEMFFSLSEQEQIEQAKNIHFTSEKTPISDAFNEITSILDNWNYQWTLFLLNYDLQTQLDFLNNFSGSWWVAAIFIGLIAVFIVLGRRRSENSLATSNTLTNFMLQIENWALDHGLVLSPNRTPLANLEFIGQKFPALDPFLKQVATDYEMLVYKEEHREISIKTLKKRWKELTGSLTKKS